MSSSPPTPLLSTFTEVYFHHTNGGSIYKQGKALNPINGPVLSAKQASPFRIIPLNTDTNKPMSSNCWTISSKSNYYDKLCSEDWSTVAIQNEDGQYLSCRRSHPLNGSLAEYRDEIDAFEQFKVDYNTSTNTFSFKSHNDLYLHYNHFLGIIAFKERDKDWASWIVNPFTLHDPLNADLIRFMGVVTSDEYGCDFLMQKNCAVGTKPAWNSEVILKGIVNLLIEKMSSTVGTNSRYCTIFEGEDKENNWYVTKTKEGVLNIVITSTDCPAFIGTMCIEEMETIFDKYEAIEQKNALDTLLVDIMNKYQFSITGTISDKMKSYNDEMNGHILKLQENVDHAEDFVTRCEEMKHLGCKAYKKLSELPGDKWTKGAKKAPDILVKGVSSLAGSFVGSKFGAKMFGDKANIVIDATSSFEKEQNGPIYKFWMRRFISFGANIGEVEIDLTTSNEFVTEEFAPNIDSGVFVPPPIPPSMSNQSTGDEGSFVPPPVIQSMGNIKMSSPPTPTAPSLPPPPMLPSIPLSMSSSMPPPLTPIVPEPLSPPTVPTATAE